MNPWRLRAVMTDLTVGIGVWHLSRRDSSIYF